MKDVLNESMYQHMPTCRIQLHSGDILTGSKQRFRYSFQVDRALLAKLLELEVPHHNEYNECHNQRQLVGDITPIRSNMFACRPNEPRFVLEQSLVKAKFVHDQ